jgi:FAD:protein FMN transferase
MSPTVTIPVERVDESFRALGSTVRIAIAAPGARVLLARARAEIHAFEACASRFRPDSELCALNADPRHAVPASSRLRAAVAAALWAARESGGLVDPCLLDELEAAGYDRSFARRRDECRLMRPMGASDDIRAARPHPAARWRLVSVDDRRGLVERPRGLRLDLGGSGKGHVADRVAGIVGSAREWLVDAGGDLRVGGEREVRVAHPLREEPAAVLQLTDGAIATSSVVRRSWRAASGTAHHLLDPATGRPAWTGLLSVTALAPTTLHAETLAKAALLSGPDGARRILARHGGLAIHDDGEVEAA